MLRSSECALTQRLALELFCAVGLLAAHVSGSSRGETRDFSSQSFKYFSPTLICILSMHPRYGALRNGCIWSFPGVFAGVLFFLVAAKPWPGQHTDCDLFEEFICPSLNMSMDHMAPL